MKKLTTDDFIAKSIEIHGLKYDYSKVNYINMQTPVTIICSKHGEFQQLPYNHVRGAGCTLCNKIDKRVLSYDDFVEKSRNVHGFRYDYSQVRYKNSKTKVTIVCPEHGPFEQKPEKHWAGQGCPLCCKNHKKNTKSFIDAAKRVHGDLYDYSKVDYVDSQTKVCIIDKDYGEFWQKPYAHLNGEGHILRKPEKCYITKKANGTLNSSKPEAIVYDLLVEKFGEDDIELQYKSENYPFACDFYVKSLDLYIELNLYVTHGGHWFDCNNQDDVNRLAVLKSRVTKRNMYQKMVYVWTKSDIEKRTTAINNHLNYVVFWKYDLSDFYDWYNAFDENPVLKII